MAPRSHAPRPYLQVETLLGNHQRAGVAIGTSRDTSRRTAQCVQDLGYRHSGLHDFLRWPRPPGAPSQLSTGTAAEISDFMARLSRDELFDESQSEVFRRWLGAGADTSMVASTFEPDPLAHYLYTRGIWVLNKTGTDQTIRADCGVIMTPQRRISYGVFANWEPGSDRVMEVVPIMRKVGAVIGSYLAV